MDTVMYDFLYGKRNVSFHFVVKMGFWTEFTCPGFYKTFMDDISLKWGINKTFLYILYQILMKFGIHNVYKTNFYNFV